MLGCGDDRRVGCVRDDDAAPRRGGDIDVVDADAGAPDHLQELRPLEHVRSQLSRRTDDDRVAVGDRLLERRVPVDLDVEPGAQQLDPRLGDLLPDQDLQTGIPSA